MTKVTGITGSVIEYQELYLVIINYNNRQYVYDRAFKTSESAQSQLDSILNYSNKMVNNHYAMIEQLINCFLLYNNYTKYRFIYRYIAKGHSYYSVTKA